MEISAGRVGVVADVGVLGDRDGVAEEDVLGGASVDELGDGRIYAESFEEGGGEVREFGEGGVVGAGEACGSDFIAETVLYVLIFGNELC